MYRQPKLKKPKKEWCFFAKASWPIEHKEAVQTVCKPFANRLQSRILGKSYAFDGEVVGVAMLQTLHAGRTGVICRAVSGEPTLVAGQRLIGQVQAVYVFTLSPTLHTQLQLGELARSSLANQLRFIDYTSRFHEKMQL